MIIRLGFAPAAPGISTHAFLDAWTSHIQKSKAFTDTLGYVQDRAVLEAGRHLLPYPGFDALAETFYESKQAFYSSAGIVPQQPEASSGPGREPRRMQMSADGATFLDRSKYFYCLGQRKLPIKGTRPDGAVKLMTFLRAHPVFATAMSLHEVFTSQYRDVIAAIHPIRHEQILLEPEAAIPRACDAVDVIWFPSASDALAYLRSDTAYAAERSLTGLAFGTERLVASAFVAKEPPDEE